MSPIYDYAIVGAGIAGASIAAELSRNARVLVLEAEALPGYHATGRSAAFWSETYGGPGVTPLTRASGPWLNEHGFLTQRGKLHIGRANDATYLTTLESTFEDTGVMLSRVDPRAMIDGLKPDWSIGLYETSCADIDVAGLHHHYLKQAQRFGAELRCNAALANATMNAGVWIIDTGVDSLKAQTLINAAGAWADDIARRCSVAPLGLTPYRRTMVQARLQHSVSHPLPLMIALDGSFYVKSEGADRIWLTPHDESPVAPGDVAPEEADIALAMARYGNALEWPVGALERKWAGLRCFAPDRLPVYGPDPDNPQFFWFAGQGGFGIQTAPAAAKLASTLLTSEASYPMIAGLDVNAYRPDRLRRVR